MFIKANEFKEKCSTNVLGGYGEIYSKDIWPENSFPKAHGKFLRLVRIPKGSTLGVHFHDGETELYFALSGKIMATDNDKEVIMEEGDVLITGKNGTHSLSNSFDEDFLMVAIILND